MGFLDDLKKQAGSVQSRQADEQQTLERRTQLVEAAALDVRRYLMELAAQLAVIRPHSTRRYAFDRHVVLDGLPLVDVRFDARRKELRDLELVDHVLMTASVRADEEVRLTRNFVNDIEQLERRLDQASARFEREPVRNPANGKLLEMRYAFVPEVQVCVRMRCDHDAGRLHFMLRNLDGLETVECFLPPHEVDQARLDQLARWWVGEPNTFLDGAREVRRIEAR